MGETFAFSHFLAILCKTTLLHENFAPVKFPGHFNFASFLPKIAFHGVLISRLGQNYEFRGILISRFKMRVQKLGILYQEMFKFDSFFRSVFYLW